MASLRDFQLRPSVAAGLTFGLLSCAAGTTVLQLPPEVSTEAAVAQTRSFKTGRLSILSYNIHGTYVGHQVPFTWKTRTSRFPWIGRLTGQYDLVLLQEFLRDAKDLYRGHLLESSPLKTQILAPGPIGRFYDSGLAVLVTEDHPDLKFNASEYRNFSACAGLLFDVYRANDCLSQKGVLHTTFEFLGEAIHFYDTHLDAGRTNADRAARKSQLKELSEFIEKTSGGEAVVVAGDFNTRLYAKKKAEDRDELAKLVDDRDLHDICGPGDCGRTVKKCKANHRIDFIFYRNSPLVELEPAKVKCEMKLRPKGSERNLSDHPALSTVFKITAYDRYGEEPGETFE